jgi:hypothetical protein
MRRLFEAAPITFILVCGGILVALVSVIIAIVIKGGWKDRGFMERDGCQLHMVNLPWTIYTEPNVPETYIIILEIVVKKLLSNGIGVFGDVIHSATLPPNIKVLVSIDDGIRAGNTKHQYDKRTGEILTAFVSLAPNLSSTLAERIISHEIGHVMGLDHDEHVSSIMYPIVQDRPQDFTDKDIGLLRRKYG